MSTGQHRITEIDLSQFVIESKAEITKDIHGNDCVCEEGFYWVVEHNGLWYSPCRGKNAFEAKEWAYRTFMCRNEE